MSEEITNTNTVEGGSIESNNSNLEATTLEQTKTEEKTYKRDDVNKIVAAEKAKAIEEATAKYEAKAAEEAKVAKMKEEERVAYELQKEREEKAETQAKLDAYLLKDEATKIATAEGLPVELLGLYNFRHINKEEMPEKIKEMASVFKGQVKIEVSKRTDNQTPELHSSAGGALKTPPTMF